MSPCPPSSVNHLPVSVTLPKSPVSGGEDAPLAFQHILLGLLKSVLLASGSQLTVAKHQEQHLPRPRPTDSVSLSFSLSRKNLLPSRLRKTPGHRLLPRSRPRTPALLCPGSPLGVSPGTPCLASRNSLPEFVK